MPDDVSTVAPVDPADTSTAFERTDGPEPGIALCLSGGGYRAMLFHVGALWRLNELGYLAKLDRISSVSGGSITAGVLGSRWSKLAFDAGGVAQQFGAQLVDPVRALADTTIDQGSIVAGILTPGSIADKVVEAYRTHLFGEATLQDLPDDPPRFVINATGVQTGVLVRFSKPYIADYHVGMIKHPRVELARAVAASSAFPPVLSPLTLDLDPALWEPPAGPGSPNTHTGLFRSRLVLTDGGVYDNLGLETAWKRYTTVLVSDGGGKMSAEEEPNADWARHAIRVNGIIDNQVRSLRKRQLISSYARLRRGTYWGIRSDIRNYRLADALPCPLEQTTILADAKTRLKRLDGVTQERLINWGYAICDAGMRRWVDPGLPKPGGFPYPASAVG